MYFFLPGATFDYTIVTYVSYFRQSWFRITNVVCFADIIHVGTFNISCTLTRQANNIIKPSKILIFFHIVHVGPNLTQCFGSYVYRNFLDNVYILLDIHCFQFKVWFITFLDVRSSHFRQILYNIQDGLSSKNKIHAPKVRFLVLGHSS